MNKRYVRIIDMYASATVGFGGFGGAWGRGGGQRRWRGGGSKFEHISVYKIQINALSWYDLMDSQRDNTLTSRSVRVEIITTMNQSAKVSKLFTASTNSPC